MATTLRGNRYRTSRHSRAAFARAARQCQRWQQRPTLNELLFPNGGATGQVDDWTAARRLATGIIKQAIVEQDWEWLEGEEVYLFAALLGLDEAAWQRQVRRAKG